MRKLIKVITTYWGDIVLLALHPFALRIGGEFIRQRTVNKSYALYIFIAYAVFAVIALTMILVFKSRRVLRDWAYFAYAFLAMVSMLLYFLGTPLEYLTYQDLLLTTFAEISLILTNVSFTALIFVRFSLMLYKKREKKRVEKALVEEESEKRD